MICHVTVNTANMEQSIEFYRWLLDLPIDRRFPMGNGGEIVFFGAPDETKFEVIYSPDTEVKPSEGVTIGFAVDSLSDKISMLESRNIPHSPVISPGPHAAFCFFNDLNGVRIQLFEER